MTKDKAAKYNGKWKQVKTDNMDAVSKIQLVAWLVHKIRKVMKNLQCFKLQQIQK